jgi:alcohol dehydrogenase, propanol-preferring
VAVSSGPEKEGVARDLGAHHYIDSRNSDAAAELRKLGGAKIVLCTAPNAEAIAGLIDGLADHGQLIVVAAPQEPIMLHPGRLFEGALSIKGWHGQRASDAIAFSLRYQVMPVIETYPLERAPEAFDRMMAAQVRFRAVLAIA